MRAQRPPTAVPDANDDDHHTNDHHTNDRKNNDRDNNDRNNSDQYHRRDRPLRSLQCLRRQALALRPLSTRCVLQP